MGQVIDVILTFPFEPVYPRPQILVVSPVFIKEGIEDGIYGCFTKEAVEMSRAFAREYRQICSEKGCCFFDAASVAQASDEDKLHMTAAEHKKLAEALAPAVKGCLADTSSY